MVRRTWALTFAAALSILVVGPSAQVSELPTSDRANSYDDGWQSQWVAHARSLLTSTQKTDGFVLQIGDSITHSFAYAAWPRQGTGATLEDAEVLAWMKAGSWGSGNFDVTHKNGWYLAAADTTSWRGMTSSGGLSLDEVVWGCCNGEGPAMPASTTLVESQDIVSNTAYVGNLQIDTVISAFRDAQFAVVMLGSNDPGNTQNLAHLTAIVDKLEANRIVPILSTIPPRSDAFSNDLNVQFNASITQLAQSRNLPLIDYYQEILRRRPGTSWSGTLISVDGLHPTASGGGFSIDSHPYLPGGDPATDRTGDALMNVGYLLRSWLVVQKLKEVKQSVIDEGNRAPEVALTHPVPGSTYTAPASLAVGADASDSDGAISKVEFYANGTRLADDSTSPYEITWDNVAAGSYSLTARAIDDLGAISQSSAVTVTVTPSTIHVGDLESFAASSSKQHWRGTVTITVHDTAEAAVPGAVVSGQWTSGYSGTGTCKTDSSGQCSVVTGNVNVKKSTATFSLTGVSHPTSAYRATANHDVDGDTNGSTIIVRKP